MIPELKRGNCSRYVFWDGNFPRNRPPAPEKDWLEDHPIQGSQGHQTSATCITCQLGLGHLSTYTLEFIINCASKAAVKITFPRNYQLIYAYIYIDTHTHTNLIPTLKPFECRFSLPFHVPGRREEGKTQAQGS